jgi:hypothetical protein
MQQPLTGEAVAVQLAQVDLMDILLLQTEDLISLKVMEREEAQHLAELEEIIMEAIKLQTQETLEDLVTEQAAEAAGARLGREATFFECGTAIAFDPAFQAAPHVVGAIQSAAAGEILKITSVATTGFTAQALDAAGSGVARTIHWYAKGY